MRQLAAWPRVVVPPLRRVRDALVRLQLLRRHVAVHVCRTTLQPLINQTGEADAGLTRLVACQQSAQPPDILLVLRHRREVDAFP